MNDRSRRNFLKASAVGAAGLALPFTAATGSAAVLGCDSQALTPEIRGQIGYVTEGHRLYRWMRIGALEKFQKAFFPDCWNSQLFEEMLDYFDLSKKQKIKSRLSKSKSRMLRGPTRKNLMI